MHSPFWTWTENPRVQSAPRIPLIYNAIVMPHCDGWRAFPPHSLDFLPLPVFLYLTSSIKRLIVWPWTKHHFLCFSNEGIEEVGQVEDHVVYMYCVTNVHTMSLVLYKVCKENPKDGIRCVAKSWLCLGGDTMWETLCHYALLTAYIAMFLS